MLMSMQCKDRTMITDKKKKKKLMLIHTNKIIGSQHRNKIQTIHLPINQAEYILNTLHTNVYSRPSALLCK